MKSNNHIFWKKRQNSPSLQKPRKKQKKKAMTSVKTRRTRKRPRAKKRRKSIPIKRVLMSTSMVLPKKLICQKEKVLLPFSRKPWYPRCDRPIFCVQLLDILSSYLALWRCRIVRFLLNLSQKSGCSCVLRLRFLRCRGLSSEDLLHTRELQDLPSRLREKSR